jgi:hypothetical protein
MNPTPGRPTVSFRGLLFSGQTHEFALKNLAKRFPNYRSTPRKSDPIARGWTDSNGIFTPDYAYSSKISRAGSSLLETLFVLAIVASLSALALLSARSLLHL